MKFRDAIEEVRSRTDIVEVVGSHVVLKRTGRNFKGLCPFHTEKTPSFTVSAEKQLFHCFGCSVGGSVFDFVMQIRNYSFAEALEFLAERVGVTVDEGEGKDRLLLDQQRREQEACFEINRVAADFYHAVLIDEKQGEGARTYLDSRGIDLEVIKRLQLGFAPANWDSCARHLIRKGLTMKRAEKLGLVSRRQARPDQPVGYYDKFRDRIIFPIFDLKKRVVGFGGRLLHGEGAKYINSSQSLLFDKSRTLYLLDQAEETIRKERRTIVVEGYMDAIALHRHGVQRAVATLGTALTAAHGKLLARFVDRVTTIFDGDRAGRQAALRTLAPMVLNGLDAGVVLLPAGEDPDSLLAKAGTQALQQRLEEATALLDFCVEDANLPSRSSRERAHLLEEIVRVLAKVPNRFQRELFLKQFQNVTGFSEVPMTAAISAVGSRRRLAAPIAEPPRAVTQLPTCMGEEAMLVVLAFENENVYELLRSYEGPPFLAHPVLKEILRDQLEHGNSSAGDFGALCSRLEDPALRQRLQKTSFEVGEMPIDEHMRAARDCIRKILRKRFQSQMREFSQRISAAEKRGDKHGVSDLLKQKKDLLDNLQIDV